MDAEVPKTLVAAVAFLGGFAWSLRRARRELDRVEISTDERVLRTEGRLVARKALLLGTLLSCGVFAVGIFAITTALNVRTVSYFCLCLMPQS